MNDAPASGPALRLAPGDLPLRLTNAGPEPTLAVVTAFGVPTQPEPAAGNGYRIERQLLTLDGAPADPAAIALNDRLVAVVTVTPERDLQARLIVSDPLPAGLEIENPNLLRSGETGQLAWLTADDVATHTEFRADRFAAAVDWQGAAAVPPRLHGARGVAGQLPPPGRERRGHVPPGLPRPHRRRHRHGARRAMSRRRAALLPAAALALAAGALAFDRWVDATVLPPLAPETSAVVVDRHGALLSAYTVADGRWRLPVTLDAVDRGYLDQLVAFEDRRFRAHAGVDPLALARAAMQSLAAGRVVSGGSTLTMQVARLLEEGPTGTLQGKLRQMRVALALERRLDKDAILALYLTLAPYGGNLEGVRAASLAWLGKEPRRLTPAEAALLVALPQVARGAAAGPRPGRGAGGARPGAGARRRRRRARPRRGRRRAGRAGADAAAAVPGAGAASRRPAGRGPPGRGRDRDDPRRRPAGAARSAPRRARPRPRPRDQRRPDRRRPPHRRGPRPDRRRRPARPRPRRLRRHEPRRALAGLDAEAARLRPRLRDAGIAHPETMVEDRPMRFGTYAPQNLDRAFLGPISARTALQASRNLPAVALLDAVGPAQLLARLRRAGAAPRLPPGGAPGLAIALGGVGLTPRGPRPALRRHRQRRAGGAARRDARRPGRRRRPPARRRRRLVCRRHPARHAAAGRTARPGASPSRPAPATATATPGRSASTARTSSAVWFGRPDGASVPGALGLEAAAPALFDAFARLCPEPVAAAAAARLRADRRRRRSCRRPSARFHARGAADAGGGPEIAFPPDGARVDLGLARGAGQPLAIRLGAGAPPFRWLVDGAPLPVDPFARQAEWRPDGVGFVDLAVIDATGRAARASVFLE